MPSDIMAEQHDIRLSQFWDALVAGTPDAVDIDQSIADPLRHAHTLFAAPKPGSARERARQRIFASDTRSQESDMSTLVLQPPLVNGRSALSPPVPFPTVPSAPKPAILSRRALLSLAAAILIAFAGIGGYLAEQRYFVDDSAPAVIPAVQETPVSDWPMYRGNPGRTGEASDLPHFEQPVELWSVQLGGSASRSPAVVGGIVYAGSADGMLRALDADTGEEIWRFQADGPMESTPTVANGVVYMASETGTFYAIDTETGSVRWQFGQAAPMNYSAIVIGDLVYVGAADGSFHALEAATGRERWSFVTGGPITRTPGAGDGVIYVPSEDGHLYSLDALDGTERWRFSVGNPNVGTSSVVGDAVYLTHTQGTVVSILDVATGTERSRVSSPTDTGMTPPTIVDGAFYAGSGDRHIYRIDPADGTVVWAFELAAESYVAPVVTGGVVYGSGLDATLRALGIDDGQELWSFPLDGGVQYGPSIADGKIFISTDAGTLYALGAGGDGTPAVTPATPPAAASTDVEFLWESDGGQQDWIPVDSALQPDGNLAVTSGSTPRVIILSPDGDVVGSWEELNVGDGPLTFIAMDADGNFYLTNYENGLILQFDPNHTFIRSWGSGTGDGQFGEVSGIAIAPDGTIYVSDFERNDIQRFDADGNYLGTIGGPGTEPGQFMNPSGIDVDAEGNLWVAEVGNNRITKFSPEGEVLMTFGSAGGAPGQFNEANAVTVDAAGRIYVTEFQGNRIQVFDPEGRFLYMWGERGSGEGQFTGPYNAQLDGQGNIYVTDLENGRVQKFKPPEGS
jgi:outer membrane protein assembly factor BamB